MKELIVKILQAIIRAILGEEPPRNGASEQAKKLAWYPLAATNKDLVMKSKGKYANNYPVGAVVHFTAGHFSGGLNKAIDSIEGGIKNGYNFMVISYDGKVVQACPLTDWGYHAGKSSWPGLGESVSSKLVGIEINCAGKLEKRGDKYYTWFNLEIPQSDVRHVAAKDNVQAGYYHKYSKEQEDALVELLLWMKSNNPDIFSFDFVLGHDEVAPDRKNDPGGSLSVSMPEFRNLLKQKYKERYS